MNKHLLKDTLGWGFLLWLIGYVLGIVLFMMVPQSVIGWIIMPIGTAITLWVLFKKINTHPFRYYFLLSVVWSLCAIVFDYIFLVTLFKSTGYYKIDVYVYYGLTFLLPLFAGYLKRAKTT